VLPPEAIEDDKRRASYHFVLVIDDIAVLESPATEALDTCRVTGRVEIVYRRPLFHFGPARRAPRKGKPLSVSVPCWRHTRHPEPPGPSRLHYGGRTPPRRIEVWGSIIDNEFAVFELEAID